MSSFFKRRNNNASMIPPVAPPAGSAGAPPAYVQDPYAAASRTGNGEGSDPYSRRAQAQLSFRSTQAENDPYGEAQATEQRSELLSGYKPQQQQAERKYGYAGRDQEEDFDEDEEVEGIKQQMTGVKQESLASTRWVTQRSGSAVLCLTTSVSFRNALRIAREAEDTARGTIGKLADQSGECYHTPSF